EERVERRRRERHVPSRTCYDGDMGQLAFLAGRDAEKVRHYARRARWREIVFVSHVVEAVAVERKAHDSVDCRIEVAGDLRRNGDIKLITVARDGDAA